MTMKNLSRYKKHMRKILPALVRSIQKQSIFQLIADHPYSIVSVSN